jgi:hypothetical protein
MRNIIKTVGKLSETVEGGFTLEEALFRLEFHKRQSRPVETFHISYDDKNLNLEEWEEEWVEACSERDKRLRKSLAEERKNGMLTTEEVWENLDWDDYEPTDRELEFGIDNEDIYYEKED